MRPTLSNSKMKQVCIVNGRGAGGVGGGLKRGRS